MPPEVPPMPAEVRAALAAQGVELEPGEGQALQRYLQLLLEANERFNLTAVTDPVLAWTRHIQDSLSLVPFIVSAEARTLLDVGSGGGLPGIPLAIVLPDVQVTLLETTGKKAEFLRQTAATLGLRNVQVVQARAEDAGQDHHQYRERFDVVTSRAVGRLAMLLELTVPFARELGTVLSIKGEQAEAEVADAKQALHLLHAHFVDAVRTPTGTIVVVQKQRKTPRAYPRTAGEPKRKPLGARDER
ncbi:MAG: 16S rRNA (guanine(527)-N(7))-methyltransferase RsmG [Phycisphaerales bacterium]